jgi:hypothetical protein
MSWVSLLLLQPYNTHENKHEQNSTLNKRKNHGKKNTWSEEDHLKKMMTTMVKMSRVTS